VYTIGSYVATTTRSSKHACYPKPWWSHISRVPNRTKPLLGLNCTQRTIKFVVKIVGKHEKWRLFGRFYKFQLYKNKVNADKVRSSQPSEILSKKGLKRINFLSTTVHQAKFSCDFIVFQLFSCYIRNKASGPNILWRIAHFHVLKRYPPWMGLNFYIFTTKFVVKMAGNR
jgi:hypothetical protein